MKSIETYEREEGHCTRGNKRLPRGTKRLGLALLPLTLNCLWNSQSQGFPEGIDWRWETSFVTLLRNIKHRLQRKGHREPVQLGLRLWKKTAQLSPCQARQLQEACGDSDFNVIVIKNVVMRLISDIFCESNPKPQSNNLGIVMNI